MSYQSWRQQWRVLAAIELLSKHLRVTDIAYRLGFSSDSAFISFFRQKTGFTPLHFIENQQ
ncbi:Bacterial regulatory helix-turn-helix s, AraC family protein [Moritella viscosa]|nr:helix-turn-helix domain-containing protein [Moritella viscosa]SHO00906.1 Bacterial regulatory helix-turn-helix s, AraC family protein [Moritella viscosa]SHO20381.1 Bacterial regulatory helix-turn-helix s, AraC family protein [Moritella viscosa]